MSRTCLAMFLDGRLQQIPNISKANIANYDYFLFNNSGLTRLKDNYLAIFIVFGLSPHIILPIFITFSEIQPQTLDAEAYLKQNILDLKLLYKRNVMFHYINTLLISLLMMFGLVYSLVMIYYVIYSVVPYGIVDIMLVCIIKEIHSSYSVVNRTNQFITIESLQITLFYYSSQFSRYQIHIEVPSSFTTKILPFDYC